MSTNLRHLLDLLATQRDTTVNLTGSWRYFRPVFMSKSPACEAACPAGNPIREFMRLAAQGDMRGALSAVKAENPLPSVCGRVCHHPCASDCARGDCGDPLAPYLIERALGDSSAEHGACLPEPLPATGKSVAVVGSGPAGLACAYHCALLGHSVTIFESAPRPGGMLTAGIPEYRLPRAALERDLEFIKLLNIKLVANHRVGSLDELASFDAVCICAGAHGSRPLGVPGDSLPGVLPGLHFLRDVNSGGRPDIGRRAVIIGGGNTAMDCARAALRLGAEAQILYRRGREEMPALTDEIAEAIEEGVRIEFFAAPVRVIEKKGRLAEIEFIRTEPGEPGPDGRREPVPVPGSEFTVAADTLITAVGESPETSWLPAGLLSRGGSVTVDPVTLKVTSDTNDISENLFCAGDAAAGVARTVSGAIGSGKRAAMAIDVYLGKGVSAEEAISATAVGTGGTLSMKLYKQGDGANPADVIKRGEGAAVNAGYAPAQRPVHAPAAERIRGFGEVNPGLPPELVVVEAARCLRCGTCTDCGTCSLYCPDFSVVSCEGGDPRFDLDFCKGCGICARECPRAALVMIEEEK